MKNFLSRIFKKNLIKNNEDILGIPKDVLKKYKQLLRKVKDSKRINDIKVVDICGYEPDVSCKIYRREYCGSVLNSSCFNFSKTILYEFLDDNDENFVVKAKRTSLVEEKDDDEDGSTWHYRYKIYFSKNNGKTWDKILFTANDFHLYIPKKSKDDNVISYRFDKTIDYELEWFHYGYAVHHPNSILDELVEEKFNTYEKCKSHNKEVLNTIMENNVNNLSSIFGVDLHLNP
jgi:hypothetical protein